jgi:hypothetical protein
MPLTEFDAPLEPLPPRRTTAPATPLPTAEERLFAPMEALEPAPATLETPVEIEAPSSVAAPPLDGGDDLESLFSGPEAADGSHEAASAKAPKVEAARFDTSTVESPKTETGKVDAAIGEAEPLEAVSQAPRIDRAPILKGRAGARDLDPRAGPEHAPAFDFNGRPTFGPVGVDASMRGRNAGPPLAVRRAYLIAVVASVIWAGCMWAFALNYQNPFGSFEYRPFAMTAFAGLCLLPPIFICLAAYALKQGFGLARETDRARRMADDLVLPAALASERAAGAARSAEAEVGRAAAVAGDAERQILELRRLLAEESDRLLEAADHAERRAQSLARGLAREREQMSDLAETLGASVEAVNAAIQSQSQLVAEASDLATAQIQEAEVALAARTAGVADALAASLDAAHAVLNGQAQLVAEVSDLAATQLSDAEAALSARAVAFADVVDASIEAATGAMEAQSRLVAEASDAAASVMRDAEASLAARASALTQAAQTAADTTAEVVDASIEAATELMEAQSRLVADASDAAAGVMRDAESALIARTSALTEAAATAAETTALAGESLNAHAQELRGAGEAAAGAASAASGAVAAERERLVVLAEGLRADQDHILGRIEAHKALILEASGDARTAVDELTTASEQSAAVLRDLAAEAAAHVSQLIETAQSEAAALSRNAETGMRLFSGFVAEERAAIEAETRTALDALAAAAADTRRQAGAQLDQARQDFESLGAAASAAGALADEAFDSRMQTARRLIEGSSALVDDAGQRSAGSIEAGLSAARATLGELRGLLEEIDQKARALPANAQTQIDDLRAALASGIGDLTSAARHAAQETQAIDAAFQNRIRENYQILSDALRLMSRAAAGAPAQATAAAPRIAAASPPAAAPIPVSADREIRLTPTEAPAPPPVRTGALPEPAAAPSPISAPTIAPIGAPAVAALSPPVPAAALAAVGGPAAQQSSAEVLGLRPRLRLTPDVAPPPAPSQVSTPPFRANAQPTPQAAARPTAGGEWSWKDLLSSIDEPPLDDDVLADRMISAIEGLGLDAPTLLPLSRIDEIAAAVQAGDVTGVKEAVRASAPSAVRRLSRRVLTDHVLRAQADRYLRRYEDLLTDSARRDRDGFMTATLLGSDPGRAFLLFKAAVGELH